MSKSTVQKLTVALNCVTVVASVVLLFLLARSAG